MELTYYVDERPGSELLREVRARLEYGGRIELHVVAEPEDLADQDRSLADEAERLVAWLEANPKGTLTAFNDLRAEEGGSDSLVWYVRRPVPGQSEGGLPVACLAPSLLADAAWVFDSDSVAGAAASQGPTGHFGVAVEVNAERESAFRAFTEHYVGRKLAIVVDGRAWSTPVLAQPLTNSFFLDAGLDEAGAEALAAAIRSPFPWPVRFVGVR